MYSIPKIDEKRDNKSHVNEGGQHLLQSVGQDRHFKWPLCPSLSLSLSRSLSLSLCLSPPPLLFSALTQSPVRMLWIRNQLLDLVISLLSPATALTQDAVSV